MEEDRLKPIRRLGQRLLVRFGPYIIAGLILLILPPIVPGDIRIMMAKFLAFAVFAMGFNLIFGYLGLLSLGQGVYFGAGGYAVAVLQFRFGIDSFWIGMPLAIFSAALLAAILGPIVLRSTGMYFLLLTFALGQLLYSLAWNWPFVNTPGMRGITGIIPPDLGIPGFTWNFTNFYYFVLIGFVICYFLLHRITNSSFGHSLVGIREGEPRMQAFGYNTWLYKYIAFIISGGFSGVAGALFAWNSRIIDPSHFAVKTSFLPMVMAIIGGSGTLFGPAIGAAVVIFVEYFASINMRLRWPLILGGIFIVAVMFARDGIGVYLSKLWGKVSDRYGIPKS